METNGQQPNSVALPSDSVQLRIRNFESQILYFNGMYKLPVAPYPSAQHLREHVRSRIEGFLKTVRKEVSEGDDLLLKIQNGELDEEEFLAEKADWLGDIIIYCASEMAKYGLPIMEVLRIIMQSNFSKLQADGTVLYDANGKVLKGPGYWKPEPLLLDMIRDLRADAMKGKQNDNNQSPR